MIDAVVVRREKTFLLLSGAGSGATEIGDVGISAVESGVVENSKLESNGSDSSAAEDISSRGYLY